MAALKTEFFKNVFTIKDSAIHIRSFFVSHELRKRYTDIKECDNGYLVVMADYEGIGNVEEYIDLLPILQNLYINPQDFLKPIKSVRIDYNDCQ